MSAPIFRPFANFEHFLWLVACGLRSAWATYENETIRNQMKQNELLYIWQQSVSVNLFYDPSESVCVSSWPQMRSPDANGSLSQLGGTLCHIPVSVYTDLPGCRQVNSSIFILQLTFWSCGVIINQRLILAFSRSWKIGRNSVYNFSQNFTFWSVEGKSIEQVVCLLLFKILNAII